MRLISERKPKGFAKGECSMKKLLALLLALMMIISLGCVSFSAQEDIYETNHFVYLVDACFYFGRGKDNI